MVTRSWWFGVGLFGALSMGCEKAADAPATPTGQAVAIEAPGAGTPSDKPPAPAPAANPHAGMVRPPAANPHASGQLPPGHPPIGTPAPPHGGGMRPAGPMAGGGSMGDLAAESGVDMPLVLEGAGSVAELKGRLAKVTQADLHADLEEAFRKVFTLDRARRDSARATALLEPLLAHEDLSVSAFAQRVMGYVRINSGFDSEGAKVRYMKAVELDPDYGEAHYALAFTLAISDLGQGKVHFDRAMALGVPDTRGLRAQFYRD